ncbi:RNA polymerase II-associated protein 1 isoform X2 [Nilaparvata lugens]|uniref:RNA polymerase II-associated protein 1 isoform X2 n=1 Tax=Nilaparvata lugens TaxID=108931 RepID=UPI00193CD3F5|nr:RNA polymerase II-associated protein 1 isoform X2 [Nilaparvata lugens]
MASANRPPSLFAQRMKEAKESKRKGGSSLHEHCQEVPVNCRTTAFGEASRIVEGPEASAIHRENVERLAGMSEQEITEERNKLLTEMNPGLIAFLKARRSKGSPDTTNSTSSNSQTCSSTNSGKTVCFDLKPESSNGSEAMETEESVPAEVNQLATKWPNMGNVEKEKFDWMSELPKPEPPPPDQPFNARFDFNGTLLPYSDEKLDDVRKGLHHHGEEPERPGYTLQELIQLSRSSVLQQRIIALNTLSNVIEKANIYSECLDRPLLPLLLDADIFLLLRFSLDDASRPIVTTSLAALCNLIVNHCDEACLDSLLGCNGGLWQPSFKINIDMKRDEQAELKDMQILKLDVIKGALRTLILSRFRYILVKMQPESVEVVQILKCLIRIARHSHESAYAIIICPGLMDAVSSLLNFQQHKYYYPDALKLFRVIACHSESMACTILEKFDTMSIVLQCLAGDRAEGQPEALRLMLESFYLWQTFLTYNMATDFIPSAIPIIAKLLFVHIDHINAESSFGDLEHAAALQSTMTTASRVAYAKSESLSQPLMQAAMSWISLTISMETPNRSMCKLAGAAFNFLAVMKMERSTELETRLKNYLHSSRFTKALINFRKHCWLVNESDKVSSPENLPSLSAFPLCLKKECSQPLIEGLAHYVLAYNNNELSDLFLKNEEWNTYLQEFINRDRIPEAASHWYARQEIKLLCCILLINVHCQTIDTKLFYRASIILTTIVHNDERALLKQVFDKIVFRHPFDRVDDVSLSLKVKLSIESDSQENNSSSNLLLEAINNLSSIKECYVSILGLLPDPSNSLTPLSLTSIEKGCEPALPSDWQFLPILHLYNTEGKGNDAKSVAICSLQWLLILENFHPEFSSITPITARFSRVCCLLLAGDLFCDVEYLLIEILRVLVRYRHELDFESTVPGLNNFYDFYRQLVDHYVGVSYGNHTFGQYLLLPLQQRHDSRFRKLVWSEQAPLIRVLNTPVEKLVFPIGEFFEPLESDLHLLGIYFRFIAQGLIRPQWNPVLYRVAVHHVSTFIKTKPMHGFSKSVLQKIESLHNEELRRLLVENPVDSTS